MSKQITLIVPDYSRAEIELEQAMKSLKDHALNHFRQNPAETVTRSMIVVSAAIDLYGLIRLAAAEIDSDKLRASQTEKHMLGVWHEVTKDLKENSK